MEPIFILSCARSGSTLLRYILDTHPEIYAPPELGLGSLARALAIAHAGLSGQRPANPSFEVDPPEILAKVAGSISQLMDEPTRRRGKSIWCEKSPQNASATTLLTSLYPGASYICLYRNHLDTILSCLEASRYVLLPPLVEYLTRDPRSPIGAATEYWLDVTTKLVELERSGRFRTHRIRYEDLVRHPLKTLAGLFAFLGLDWDPGLIDAVYKVPHDEGLGDMFVRFAERIRPDSVGRGCTVPFGLASESQRARVEERNRELEYGDLVAEVLAARSREVALPDQPEMTTPPPEAAGGAGWVFEAHLPMRLKERRASLSVLGSSYRFLVIGPGGGSWILSQDEAGDFAMLAEQANSPAAKTTISLQVSDLVGIIEGRLNVMKLQWDGRIVFSGEEPSLEQIKALVGLFHHGS